MKYLKRVNELFDDESRRSDFSYDYLSGDLSPEDTIKWDKYKINPVKEKLLEDVPFLNLLNFREVGNINQFSFNEYREGLFILFDIHVVLYSNGKFMLATYFKSLLNNKIDWSKDFIKTGKSLEEVIQLLNNDVKKLLDEFSIYVKQFDIDLTNDGIFKVDLN
jgi:hypothetical protein